MARSQWGDSDVRDMAREGIEALKGNQCPECGGKEFYIDEREVLGHVDLSGPEPEIDTDGGGWDQYIVCYKCGHEEYIGGGC